jgi:sigma-B regulation protein RsbU (phosphoserine phosphatase)
VALQSGDILFLHTDGVDEAKRAGGAVFGADRLAQLLAKTGRQSAEGVLREVEAALQAHLGGAGGEDDITMIAVRLS